jgi:ubiquinone/menaquinone biosynthesis C-methylase UbiE
MKKIVEKYCELPTVVRRPLWRVWHNLLLRFDKNKEVTFMNYGFQSLNGDTQLALNKEDEVDRYCIQLYHEVANQVDLTNKDVLEVGSGRGGGGSYITRYLKTKSYIGMDISGGVIDFCNKKHKIPGLSFIKGIAEKLPFPNESFDALVNVESARCYADIKGFFAEVHRVLRPDGHFLFADMVKKGDIDHIREGLSQCGFKILSERNITKNVVKALDLDDQRRSKLVHSFIPKFLKGGFLQFAGAKGTERYESFATGRMEYWIYMLAKN